MAWKDRIFDMWVNEWQYQYETGDTKADVLRMSDALINRNFDICPRAARFFTDFTVEYAVRYGTALREMVANMEKDEYLEYYNLED